METETEVPVPSKIYGINLPRLLARGQATGGIDHNPITPQARHIFRNARRVARSSVCNPKWLKHTLNTPSAEGSKGYRTAWCFRNLDNDRLEWKTPHSIVGKTIAQVEIWPRHCFHWRCDFTPAVFFTLHFDILTNGSHWIALWHQSILKFFKPDGRGHRSQVERNRDRLHSLTDA